jgi:hypothetical protein
MSDQSPRTRRQPIPDVAHLVVGGDEDPKVQERMAKVSLRRYPAWSRYGLSAYHASGDLEEELNVTVDLPLDLNTQDETGLPWTFLDEASDPSRLVQGAWIVVGGPQAQAVAQVVSIESLPQGDLVHVRPLPGPVSDYAHLLSRDVA